MEEEKGEDHADPVPLHTVPLEQFKPGSAWVIPEASYFGGQVKLAGVIQRVEVLRNASYLYMHLTGTGQRRHLEDPHRAEGCSLQGAHLRARVREDRIRIAPVSCSSRAPEEDTQRRALGTLAGGDHTWRGGRAGRLEGPGPGRGGLGNWSTRCGDAPPVAAGLEEESSQKGSKKAKKKKKQKETRSKEEKMATGRSPAKAVQKEAVHLYGGTALDPKEKIRKRVLKAAQRFASKKKSKRSTSSSGTGSSSSSTSSAEGTTSVDGVFGEDTKTRTLGDKFPGALSMETLMMMRRSLLTTSGELGEEQSTKPVALLYFRNVLGRRASGAQARELLNLSCAIDALLRSRPAQALDILCQRLKAQEAVLSGTNWAVAQRLELASPDATSLIPRGELQVANRESYLDSRARWQSQSTTGAKGTNKGKTKGKSDQAAKDDKKEESRREKGKGGDRK